MKNLFIISIFLLSSICGNSQTNDTITNSVELFQFDIFGSIYFLSEY
jgi:hypothetical protein